MSFREWFDQTYKHEDRSFLDPRRAYDFGPQNRYDYFENIPQWIINEKRQEYEHSQQTSIQDDGSCDPCVNYGVTALLCVILPPLGCAYYFCFKGSEVADKDSSKISSAKASYTELIIMPPEVAHKAPYQLYLEQQHHAHQPTPSLGYQPPQYSPSPNSAYQLGYPLPYPQQQSWLGGGGWAQSTHEGIYPNSTLMGGDNPGWQGNIPYGNPYGGYGDA